MGTIQVSEVSGVLTDLLFNKRVLNYNLGAFKENDFEALKLRFYTGMIGMIMIRWSWST
jgi:hypothetical protein